MAFSSKTNIRKILYIKCFKIIMKMEGKETYTWMAMQ